MSERPTISIAEIRELATGQSFSRGQAYYDQGALSATIRRGDAIEALCAGSYPEPYRVRASLADGTVLDASCTCEYDWGGYCKHIVALLLAYAREPERFEARPSLHEALLARSPEQLVELIEEMLLLYPDLSRLIDRPQPGVGATGTLDLIQIRQELRAALDNYGGWGDRTAERKVWELSRTGERFARHGDWQTAVAIYLAIVEECTRQPDYPVDDEGEYAGAVGQVADRLANGLQQPAIVDDDALRRAILEALLGIYLWDVDYGGIGFSGDASDYLLQYARQGDIPALRTRIEAARARKRAQDYGQWAVEAYTDFLIELDLLDHTDPEVTLARLREEGMYLPLIARLLDLDRTDEVLDVVRAHLEGWDLRRVLPTLTAHDLDDAAIAIAEEKLQAEYDPQIVTWLLRRYQARGDLEASFRWQQEMLRRQPDVQSYAALKATAQQLGRWDDLRDGLRRDLEREKRYDVLLEVYLHDEEFALAWETLPKLGSSSRYWYRPYDLLIAEQSRHVMPERALPVYLKYVRQHIDRRNRGSYAEAARMLREMYTLYEELGDEEGWVTLIADLREEFRRLPAFQDELNQAGL